MHVSGIIHPLALARGDYEERGEVDDTAVAYMSAGNVMEWALIQMMEIEEPGRYVQPGEQQKDGLFGTPDLWDLDDHALHELKWTWKSSRHDPGSDAFWKYETQMKAYCWMLETGLSRLHVFHVNGTWKWGEPDGFKPVYRVWEYEWGKRELEKNWRMLLANKHLAVEEK